MIRTKKKINTFQGGVDQDTIVSKYQNTTYFDAQNMRVISNESVETGGISAIKGNVLKLEFRAGDKVIGYCTIRAKAAIDPNKDSIVFFVANAVSPNDRIYLFEGDPNRVTGSVDMDAVFAQHISGGYTYKSGYIYESDDLNFDENFPIKAEGRYENDDLRKVYWVDGMNNNIRYMILDQVDLADDPSIFDINPDIDLSIPVTSLITGGAYLSGRVQHAYQLYRKNGAATIFSPLSNTLNLSGDDGGPTSANFSGTSLGTNSGKGVQVVLTNLDPDFDRVRIVALHYQEYLVNPTVNIIAEAEYLTGSVTLIDNGFTTLGTVPIEEFRLFGQTLHKAGSLATKNNFLFFADIMEEKWDPYWLDPDDPDFFDVRAVRFRKYTDGGGPQTKTSNFGVGGTTLRHGVDGVTFWNYDDDILGISINDITQALSFPPGETITDVTNIQPYDIDASIFDIEWEDNVNVLHRVISPMGDLCDVTIQPGPAWPAMLITIKQLVGGNIFNMGTYANMSNANPSDVFALTVTYDYTLAPGVVVVAEPTDTNEGTATIYAPTDPDVIADWDIAGWNGYPEYHDGVNIYNWVGIDNQDPETFGYNLLSDGVTIGAEGPNIVITVAKEQFVIDDAGPIDLTVRCAATYDDTQLPTDNVSSARTEVYRMYAVFFNKKGQRTNPQWIIDFRMPNNDEENLAELEAVTERVLANYIYPSVEWRSLPVDPNLVGWQIFRCERGTLDRSVIANGLVSPLQNSGAVVYPASSFVYPYMTIRAEDYNAVTYTEDAFEVLSPEIAFNKNYRFAALTDFVRIDGRYVQWKDEGTNVTAPGGANDSLRSVTILGSTGPKTSDPLLEEWLYDVTEGKFLSPAHYTGDVGTPIMPPRETLGGYAYEHITFLDDGGGNTYRGDEGYTIVGINGDDNWLIDSTNVGYLYGSYLRDVYLVQYGGNTYEARSYNKVIPYSQYVSVNDPSPLVAVCDYGDTYICMFTYLRSAWPAYITGSPRDINDRYTEQMMHFPVESSINLFYRQDKINKYYQPESIDESSSVIFQNTVEDGLRFQPDTYPLDLGDLYRYNSAYSKSPNALTIERLPFDTEVQKRDDCKVIATGQKINGEYYDQWTRIFENNYIILDTKYGSINNIVNFGNRLITGQDKGIAVLSVQERSLLKDNNQLSLVLGTGDVLNRYDYLTTTSGFQDYFDMGLSDKGMYYIDRRAKTLYNLSAEGDMPFSELKGYKSFMKKYGNISTTKTGYDPLNKEFFFYVSDGTRSYNNVYGEFHQAFTGKHTFVPDRMFQLNDQFYSVKSDEVYIHNQGAIGSFYGNVEDSWVEMIINPENTNVCRFDILDIRVDVTNYAGTVDYRDEQFTDLIISNGYQTATKSMLFSGDDSAEDTTKDIVGQWRTWLLPDDQATDFYRFTDTYLRAKLIRDNTDNKQLTLHDITTFYRPIKN
jgi:hypothetical protein